MNTLKSKLALLIALAVGASQSHAALDPAVALKFTDLTADITVIGSSLILLAGVVMGFKWLKAMFF